MPNLLSINSPSKDPGEGHVYILPLGYDTIVQGTWVWNHASTQYASGFWYNSSNSSDDELTYKVYLAKGTYTFTVIAKTGGDRGILEIEIGGVSVGTIDLYSSGSVDNVILSITDIVVSVSGLKTINYKIAVNNPSSSGYKIAVSAFSFIRSA